jgi:predicted amidophosphoribosyltransferase
MKRCPNHHPTTGTNFCTICGEQMVEVMKPCPKCGAELVLEQSFCGECGTKNQPEA